MADDIPRAGQRAVIEQLLEENATQIIIPKGKANQEQLIEDAKSYAEIGAIFVARTTEDYIVAVDVVASEGKNAMGILNKEGKIYVGFRKK